MIVGTEKGIVEEEDGFFGGGDNQHMFGANIFVERGESFTEPGSARGFGVAAPVIEESVVGRRLQGEQIGDGAGFGVGRREQVFGGEFVSGEIFFDTEGRNLHVEEFGKSRAGSLGTKWRG